MPDAVRIRVIQDNLNTHTPAAVDEVFAPADAKRMLDRLEFHDTPKHGRWPGTRWVLAEIELSVLGRQCLNRRIPDSVSLDQEVTAWAQTRNAKGTTVNWRFTTTDARIKLKRLYPSILD